MQNNANDVQKNKATNNTIREFKLLKIQQKYFPLIKEQLMKHLKILFSRQDTIYLKSQEYCDKKKNLILLNKQRKQEQFLETYLKLIIFSISYDVRILKIQNIRLNKQCIARIQDKNLQLNKNIIKKSIENRQTEAILYKNILKIFSFPSLLKLRHISVEKMQLTNIQDLIYLNCSNLSGIVLRHNNIMSLKVLNKTNFKNLDYIDISDNKSAQLPSSRMKLNSIQPFFNQQYTAFQLQDDYDSIPYGLNMRLKYESEKIIVKKKVFDRKMNQLVQNQMNKFNVLSDKKANIKQFEQEI